jgi:hypothetical protein
LSSQSSPASIDYGSLPGTRYLVDSWLTAEEALAQYGATPDWPLERILTLTGTERARCQGRAWHVGAGVWVAICPTCDTYTLTYGSLPIYYGIGLHMVKAHPDAQVPGINVGLLS